MDHQHSLLFFFAILLLLNSSETPLTGALPLSTIVNGTNGQLRTYIVMVERPAEVNNTLLTDEQKEDYYRSFLPNSTLDSGEPRLIHSYNELVSGFAARLTPEEVTVMKSMDGFVHARREEIYALQTTYTYELLELNSYESSLWRESNHGEGVIVGVIDTGILPEHPSFADDGTMPLPPLKWRGRCEFGSGLCNNKLIGAVSFVGGHSPTPYDIHGHGTHVAGIAVGGTVYDASVEGSARGTAKGMAPRAHLAVYKGCSWNNKCRASDTMKCFEQAVRDGVDVINMSFGGTASSLGDTTGQMTFAAVKRKNIVTVAAVGNTGPSKSKISNREPWIITVGAASTDRRVTAVVRLGNGMELEGQSAYPSNLTGMLPIVYPGGVNKTEDTLTCQRGSMQGFDVKGKLVLCRAGGEGAAINKGRVVRGAGGAAVVILGQHSEGYTTDADPNLIPAAHVSFVDSMKLLSYLQTEKNPTGTIEFRGTNFGARPSPTVASLSARGPSLINGGILKPDIIAPGVNILSASESSSRRPKAFVFKTGTSMATPHVTGVAALLRKTHPGWSAAAIKSALMTTATPYDQDGKPIADDADEKLSPASVFAVGAGHLNPPKANDPGLIYDIGPDDYISFLCGFLTNFQVWYITLDNTVICSTRAVISAEQLNYPSILVSLGKSTTGKIIVNRTVTNVGEANSEYTARVKPPNGVAVTVNPTTLQFSDLDQKENFSMELTLTGAPPSQDDALEGEIVWVSSDNKHTVRSPIVVTA